MPRSAVLPLAAALLFVLALALALAAAPAAAQAAPITNFVVVGARRYATISNVAPDATDFGCDDTPLPLPAGWQLAALNNDARVAVMTHHFGAVCVVLRDGASLYTRTAPGASADCGAAQLVSTPASAGAPATYRVAACSRRVLIQQTAQPGDVDETAPVALAAENSIVFRGAMYAVLDGTAPTDASTAGCQARALELPGNWSLAPDNAETRAAVMGARHRFGTTCLVLAGGASIDAVTGAPCDAAMLWSVGRVHAVRACNRRILVRRTRDVAAAADTWPSAAPAAVTNYVLRGDRAYAVVENVPAAHGASGCQSAAVALPAGWAVAQNSEGARAAARAALFGTNCLVLADGSALDHAGNACDGGVNQLLNATVGKTQYYAVNWCDMRVLIEHTLPLPLPRAERTRTLAMRALVLSVTGDAATESALDVITQTLRAAGVPYDEFAAAPSAALLEARPELRTGSLAALLEPAVSVPQEADAGAYFAVVVTSSNLPRQDENGNWVSSLSNADWAALAAYGAKYRVRVAYLYSYPTPAIGVEVAVDGTGAPTAVTLDAAWAAIGANGRTLNRGARVPMTGVWHYGARVIEPALATPAMYFADAATGAPTTAVAAVEVNYQNGLRELHHFFDHATWSLHSTVLANVWLNWATRGMYQGARRVMLSAQVDDLFLKTEMWDTVNNVHPDEGPAYRATPADLQLLDAFQSRVNSVLAPGSTYVTEHAYNGAGVDLFGGASKDALYKAARAMRGKFFWESHTWSHLDLTSHNRPYYTGPLQPTTYAEVADELQRNIDFAAALFNTNATLRRYSPNAMVTPKISGLFNADALRAIVDHGIKYVVGDNSRPELVPEANLYHGIPTTEAEHGHAGVLIMPRFATEIYYDCATPEQQVSQYNFRYRAYWGRDLTLDEIMQEEAKRAGRALLAYRQDPYMFHQANLATFVWPDPVSGVPTQHSLLTLWLANVVRAVRTYSVQPIQTFTHAELGARMDARMQRDACGAVATLTLSTADKITAVTVPASNGATGSCTLPFSGLPLRRGATNADVRIERYGEETTMWVPTHDAAERTFTLSSAVTLN